MGCTMAKYFLEPPPGALGRGQKVKYHLISITKSISKMFIPNGIFILSPGSCPRDGTWVSCCLSVMLSLPKPLEEIQPIGV